MYAQNYFITASVSFMLIFFLYTVTVVIDIINVSGASVLLIAYRIFDY